jgi:hypothetical protein
MLRDEISVEKFASAIATTHLANAAPSAYMFFMPSVLHQGLIALVRDRPAFVADLLKQLLDVPVPRFTEARLADASVHQIAPVEYHADAMVLLVDPAPVLGVIFEAQLQRDDRKFYTWPIYAVGARGRYECPFVVLVVTPDAATARWAAARVDLGCGTFQAHVVGPEGIPAITDVEHAIREPQLAMLSVMAHGRGDVDRAVEIATAAAAAIKPLTGDQWLLYSPLITSALSEAARKAFEMLPQAYEFFSESQRRVFAEGEAKGKVEGKAEGAVQAILVVLTTRALAISDAQRQRIQACTDLDVLDRWLARAVTVAATNDLFA